MSNDQQDDNKVNVQNNNDQKKNGIKLAKIKKGYIQIKF